MSRPTGPVLQAYHAACEHLSVTPHPDDHPFLASLRPHQPLVVRVHAFRNVSSDAHITALCAALLAAYGVPPRLLLSPSHNLLHRHARHRHRQHHHNPSPPLVVVDFGDSPALSPRGARVALRACLLLPAACELHLDRCPRLTSLDLFPGDPLPASNRLTGLNLDATPLTRIPAHTLRPLHALAWISVRATLLDCPWRVADILDAAPALVAALFAGDPHSDAHLLHHARRVATGIDAPLHRQEDLDERFPGAPPIHTTPVSRLAHFRSFVIASRRALPSLCWVDGVHVSAHERIAAFQRVAEHFERSIPLLPALPTSSSAPITAVNLASDGSSEDSSTLTPTASGSTSNELGHDDIDSVRTVGLANYARVLPLLRDREIGSFYSRGNRSSLSSTRKKAFRPRKRKRNGPLGKVPGDTLSTSDDDDETSNRHNKTSNLSNDTHINLDHTPHSRSLKISSSRNPNVNTSTPLSKQTKNINEEGSTSNSSISNTLVPGRPDYIPRRPDFESIIATAGRMRTGSLTPGHEMTVALAAVAAANNSSNGQPNIMEQIIFPPSNSGLHNDRNWLLHYYKQHQRQEASKREDQLRIQPSNPNYNNVKYMFEGCMDVALVKRKGCCRVSYWKQGKERPRQFEYNPGKASEIVYATANGRLVVIDEESGEVQGSCNVGGQYYNDDDIIRHDRHIRNRGEWIDKTNNLNEAFTYYNSVEHDHLNDEDSLRMNIYGISWLNQCTDRFLCGDYSGNIYLYNVDNMPSPSEPHDSSSLSAAASQNKSYSGIRVTQKCEEFRNLTSISVNSTDANFAVSGSSEDIAIFDAETGRRTEMMRECHTKVINVIKFAHHNPHLLLSSSFDGTCCKWDLREKRANGTRRPIFTTRSTRDNMMACFSPDDRWLLVSAVDNEVKQYCATDGRLALHFDIRSTGKRNNFTRSYYMNGGAYIATGSCMESCVRVYNTKGAGRLLSTVDMDEVYNEYVDAGAAQAPPPAHEDFLGLNTHSRRRQRLRVQSLRANPWRDFQLCTLLVSTDQSINELVAQVDLRSRC